MTIRRKLVVLEVEYDDENYTDPGTWDWSRKVGIPFGVEVVATGDMGEVLMPDFSDLDDEDQSWLTDPVRKAAAHIRPDLRSPEEQEMAEEYLGALQRAGLDDGALCEFTNCHMEAVGTLKGRALCREHLDEYSEFLKEQT